MGNCISIPYNKNCIETYERSRKKELCKGMNLLIFELHIIIFFYLDRHYINSVL